MKDKVPLIEPRKIAVITGVAIGLGLVVHAFFLLVALVIALFVVTEWTVHQIEEHLRAFRAAHRHP